MASLIMGSKADRQGTETRPRVESESAKAAVTNKSKAKAGKRAMLLNSGDRPWKFSDDLRVVLSMLAGYALILALPMLALIPLAALVLILGIFVALFGAA